MEVLLALFLNKLKNILIILIFNFVDLLWTVASFLLLYSLFINGLRLFSTLAVQKVILKLHLSFWFYLNGDLAFDHGRSYTAFFERGHHIRIPGAAIFGFTCVWFIVDCLPFHISLLRVSSCELALDLCYSLEFIVHISVDATWDLMMAVWIHSDDFIFVGIFYRFFLVGWMWSRLVLKWGGIPFYWL